MIITCSKTLQTEIYRKAIHLSSLWMPLFLLLADRNISIIVFLALLFCNLATEYSAYKYRRSSFIGRSFRKMFFKTLRPREVIENKFTPRSRSYGIDRYADCRYHGRFGRKILRHLSFSQRQIIRRYIGFLYQRNADFIVICSSMPAAGYFQHRNCGDFC